MQENGFRRWSLCCYILYQRISTSESDTGYILSIKHVLGCNPINFRLKSTSSTQCNEVVRWQMALLSDSKREIKTCTMTLDACKCQCCALILQSDDTKKHEDDHGAMQNLSQSLLSSLLSGRVQVSSYVCGAINLPCMFCFVLISQGMLQIHLKQ